MQTAERRTECKTKKTILIVEDDQNTLKFLSFRLKLLNFDVIQALDGEEGLKDARHKTPDLIILDLGLPKISGEEVCKAIREDANKTFASTPIIMLTAKNSDVDRVIGKVIGANSYIAKPFEAGQLLKEIHKLCPNS